MREYLLKSRLFQAGKNTIVTALLYIKTVRYLRIRQIVYRIFYALRPLDHLSSNVDSLEAYPTKLTFPCYQNLRIFEDQKFLFFGITGEIKDARDWNCPSKEKLWLYNLHYFDCLMTENSSSTDSDNLNLLLTWIEDNPKGIGVGWEAYPTSLRLVNWIKWINNKGVNNKELVISIQEQAQVLYQNIEYHILGNHLIANAKALIFVGLYIKSEKSNRFLQKGLNILMLELKEQFLSDGGHFERSPMYHAIVTWDLLDILSLLKHHQQSSFFPLIDEIKKTVRSAVDWLRLMTHPDGKIAFFNDSAFGIAPEFSKIYEYAEYLGVGLENEHELSMVTGPDSGYTKLRQDSHVAIFDHGEIGPSYLTAHSHADTLSFEWSVGCTRVVVNSGTSTYKEGALRNYQRGTLAHNTVTIDNQDSSRVWSIFRVAQRAFPIGLAKRQERNRLSVTSSHDGYHKFFKKVTPSRTIISDTNSIEIRDSISGSFKHAVTSFHLHPDVKIVQHDGRQLILELVKGQLIEVVSSDDVQLEEACWFPEFGKSVKTVCLRVYFSRPKISICFRLIKIR